jgi:glycosyltransferase involved in cell wall biosynthesis
MRILLIHNQYTQYGGEDAVFQTEGELLSRHGHFVERLIFDSKKIKSFIAKLFSILKMFYNRDSATILRKKIERFRPDVIHVHNFFPLASPSIFFIANKYNIPVVATLHNYRLICPSATLYHKHKIYERSLFSIFPLDAVFRGVYRNSIARTAFVAAMTALHNVMGTWKNKIARYIVLTEFSQRKFKDSALQVSDDQFIIKPNFVVDFGTGDNRREDFFVFIGRLVEEKGIEVLLRAALLYDFKLKIIGDGPLRSVVEKYAQLNTNIQYLGFQNKSFIIDALKKSKALIFPSLWYEGFPITILEAFSTGTPVIASRLGGMCEVVTNNVNGLHFEVDDENDLVSVLKTFDQTEKESFSFNARKTYLDNYTPEQNYDQLRYIYDQVIKNKKVSLSA